MSSKALGSAALCPLQRSPDLSGEEGMPDTTFHQLFSEDGSFQEAMAPPRQQRPTKASSALGPGDQKVSPWSSS